MFIHVPNTLETEKVQKIGKGILDLIFIYFESVHHVVDESKRITDEADDLRVNLWCPSKWFWPALSVGGLFLLTRS